MSKPRLSTYGFYCSDCGVFVYLGFDSRDKIGLPKESAVCLKCAPKYENKEAIIKVQK